MHSLKAAQIERAILNDIYAEVPDLRPDLRLVPYLQVHEYEGLLFSDPEAFATALGKSHLSLSLTNIRNAFESPEDINDEPTTSPSRRIIALYPTYKKVIEGTLAAQAVGLANMIHECTHFRGWVETLAALAPL